MPQRDCPRCEGILDYGIDYSQWPDDGTCHYCGSLNAGTFMDRLEAGTVRLGPTDKNYKVYVHNDGGESFKQSYRTDSIEERIKAAAENLNRFHQIKSMNEEVQFLSSLSEDDRADFEAYKAGNKLDPMRNWKLATRDVASTKFYFQHLNEDQMKRFVELMNEKRIKLNEPGYFYRKPFFFA